MLVTVYTIVPFSNESFQKDLPASIAAFGFLLIKDKLCYHGLFPKRNWSNKTF